MTSAEGVAYQQEDYAGLGRRMLAAGIDFVVILFLPGILWMPFEGLLPEYLALVWWPGVVWLYLVVLKHSPVRTLGYRIAGVKVVNLQGGRPGLWRLTTRALFAFGGPLAPILDFFWIPGNPQKRALRDLFGQTYVVRNDAQPVSRVSLQYSTYDIWALNFVLLEPV
jgi:uncharacterized RDD family membrane protein YckC